MHATYVTVYRYTHMQQIYMCKLLLCLSPRMFNFRTQFCVKIHRMMCSVPSCNVGFTTLWVAKYGTIM